MRGGGCLPPVVFFERPRDGIPPALAREVGEAEVVVEQVGNGPLETTELPQRIFAQCHQEVHSQARVIDCPGELASERGLTIVTFVIEEVLLELVEHDEQIAQVVPRPRLQRWYESRRRGPNLAGPVHQCERPRGNLLDGPRQADDWIALPTVEHDDRQLWLAAFRQALPRVFV